MKSAVKAALLSGFVFPGLGQIYLKRYWRGTVIMLFVLAGISVIIGMVTISTLDNLKKMQSQGSVDMGAISNLAIASSANHSYCYDALLLFVACCWLFSIIDAYRIGKRRQGGN